MAPVAYKDFIIGLGIVKKKRKHRNYGLRTLTAIAVIYVVPRNQNRSLTVNKVLETNRKLFCRVVLNVLPALPY